MIENSARVARVEGGDAWIEAARPVGCGHCHENPGCSVNRGGVCADGRRQLIRVANPIGARPGDVVIVGVPEGAIWAVARWVYLVPLGLALVGALLGQQLFGGDDRGAALGTLGGLGLGLWWGRRVQGQRALRRLCEAAILRRDDAV